MRLKIANNQWIMNFITFKRDVLGHIEDLALLEEKHLLSLDLIDAGYGYYLLNIGSNDEVRKLLTNLKRQSKVYNGYADLYFKIYKKLSDTEKTNIKQHCLMM